MRAAKLAAGWQLQASIRAERASHAEQQHRKRRHVPLAPLVRVELVGHAVLSQRRQQHGVVRRQSQLVVHGLERDARPAAAVDDSSDVDIVVLKLARVVQVPTVREVGRKVAAALQALRRPLVAPGCSMREEPLESGEHSPPREAELRVAGGQDAAQHAVAVASAVSSHLGREDLLEQRRRRHRLGTRPQAGRGDELADSAHAEADGRCDLLRRVSGHEQVRHVTAGERPGRLWLGHESCCRRVCFTPGAIGPCVQRDV